jgi:hypothetical protein
VEEVALLVVLAVFQADLAAVVVRITQVMLELPAQAQQVKVTTVVQAHSFLIKVLAQAVAVVKLR